MALAQARHDRQKSGGKLLRGLIATFGLFYLVSHALGGERGIYAMLREQRRLEALNTELTDVSANRQKLENRVSRLSSGSLDLDLLDEQSRRMLGTAGKDEVMVMLPPAAKRAKENAAPQQ